ncbi:MAG: hypothetical protein L0H74_00235 [Brachybacterium sp.]|nr:hypothetical protein [Brachybacterium sp.]
MTVEGLRAALDAQPNWQFVSVEVDLAGGPDVADLEGVTERGDASGEVTFVLQACPRHSMDQVVTHGLADSSDAEELGRSAPSTGEGQS